MRTSATIFTRIIIAFLLLQGVATTISAQQGNGYAKTQNAKESLQIAQHLISKGELEKACRQLQHTIHLKKKFAVAHRELGRVLLELERYGDAIQHYETSFNIDGLLSRAAYFECGEAYFQMGDVASAERYFQLYEEKKDEKYTNKKKESGLEMDCDEMLAERKMNCEYIRGMGKFRIGKLPIAMGSSINSKDDEYLPTITNNGTRMVFTRNADQRNENIMTAARNSAGDWSSARSFDNAVNSYANEGMAKFATNGRIFHFAGCQRPDSEGSCDIYEAFVDEFGNVTEVSHLEGLNDASWDSQPCSTCHGDAIYFSSNRPGGYGGTDIYVSQRTPRGTWSKPRNLGPHINTPGNEEAPFIATDARTLYFTSTGHPGQGDGDIFISRLQESGEWTPAENMGYPINSPSKELGFYLQGDGKTAYLASSRFGGRGGLDIYSTELPEKFRPLSMVHVSGKIVDDLTDAPIQTSFKIYRHGEEYDYASDKEGLFFTCLGSEKAFTFHIEAPGYKDFMSALYLPASDNSEPIEMVIRLNRDEDALVAAAAPQFTAARSLRQEEKKVACYFEVNSHELDERAVSKLDDLVAMLSNERGWEVEVVGYADNSGDAEYNKTLSDKRANAVSDYLKEAGVDIAKVRQEGRGVLQGDSKEQRRRSRRVEIVLKRISLKDL